MNELDYYTPDYVVRYAARQAGIDYDYLREVTL